MPEAWRATLRRLMPLYSRLPAADRAELEGHTRILLAEKYFEGCGGLRITHDMKLLIAAQASLLLLHRDGAEPFPLMRSVLVYPGPFVGEGKASGPGGMITESMGWRRGESWHTPGSGGPVVLSWPDVVAGAATPDDGRNVVLHEFAHQLDGESGWVEGTPGLPTDAEAAAWKRLLAAEFDRHARAVWAGMPTVMDPYGAESPAEFFAVAVETFFEKPADMLRAHTALYNLLRGYFGHDPAERWCLAAAARAGCGAA